MPIQNSLQLKRIQRALLRSSTTIPFEVKSKMAELVLTLMDYRKSFGIFIILGWKPTWERYADTPDISQDIFAQDARNILDITPTKRRSRNITQTINFDGAILIDAKGTILHSGVMIEGLRPRATAYKVNPHIMADLSLQFGFKRKVHMRHITAITSSYVFKNTLVFTVSEETDDFHIFENGKIIYSTVRGESSKI